MAALADEKGQPAAEYARSTADRHKRKDSNRMMETVTGLVSFRLWTDEER